MGIIQSTFAPTIYGTVSSLSTLDPSLSEDLFSEIKRAKSVVEQMELTRSSEGRGAFGLSTPEGGKEMIDEPMLKQVSLRRGCPTLPINDVCTHRRLQYSNGQGRLACSQKLDHDLDVCPSGPTRSRVPIICELKTNASLPTSNINHLAEVFFLRLRLLLLHSWKQSFVLMLASRVALLSRPSSSGLPAKGWMSC